MDKFCQGEENDLKNVGGSFLSGEFTGSNIGVEIYFFDERLKILVGIVEKVKIGSDDRLTGDPCLVNGSLKETISFVEQTGEILMGSFTVFELVIEEKVGSFEGKAVF